MALRKAVHELEAITGPGYAAATRQLAEEPRSLCSLCRKDFQSSDTGRDICGPCVLMERARKLNFAGDAIQDRQGQGSEP